MTQRKLGRLKVTKNLLEILLFQGQCVIEHIQNDENGCVILTVTGHQTLPLVSDGEIPPEVRCLTARERVQISFEQAT